MRIKKARRCGPFYYQKYFRIIGVCPLFLPISIVKRADIMGLIIGIPVCIGGVNKRTTKFSVCLIF